MSLTDAMRRALTRDVVFTEETFQGVYTLTGIKPISRHSLNPSNYYADVRTLNGLTITPNGDGSYNIAGTATRGTEIPLTNLTITDFNPFEYNNKYVSDVIFTTSYIDGWPDENAPTLKIHANLTTQDPSAGGPSTMEAQTSFSHPYLVYLELSHSYSPIISCNYQDTITIPRNTTLTDCNVYTMQYTLFKSIYFSPNKYKQMYDLNAPIMYYIGGFFLDSTNAVMLEEYLSNHGVKTSVGNFLGTKRFSEIIP